MPRVEFSPENKVESPYDYPRLVLDKGERARIIVIETEPFMEWVHTLRAPQVVDGEAVMEIVNQFGKQVEQPKYDFLSRVICHGDYSILDEKGVDPTNCAACKLASETDYVKSPERRFAMHVVKYAIKAGTFEVADPFSVTLIAWVFGNKTFNAITDKQAEWGNLREHDLLLGPCDNKQFQRYEINVGAKAEWLTSDDRKQLVAQTYKENQAPDLAKLIGRTISVEALKDHLDTIIARSRIAFGSQTVPTTDEILSGSIGSSVSETINVPPTDTDTVTDEASPAEEEPVSAEASESGITDFDSLLSELEASG